MEFIRIPQVSLVDASGKRIGVYTDDPDWWQQLKLKQNQHTQNTQKEINLRNDGFFINKEAKKRSNLDLLKDYIIKKSITSISNDDSTSSLQLKSLANNEIEHKNFDESHKKCNVIGETPLHIAIIYEDLDVIRFLVESKGYSVNQRTVYSKFMPGFNTKMATNLISNSQYEGLAYFGEYPLAFAACFCNKEIYDYLISKGADPNMRDSYGNTVLHILVINNKLDMFKYAIMHPFKKADLTIKNAQQMTPLNLAAKLGRADLFSEMLELRNVEYWRYHNITCSAYPLDGLDTIGEDGKIAWNAALTFIIDGNTDDHLTMIEGGVVKRLLDDKWNTYAQKIFLQRLAFAIIHLIFLSLAVYCRKQDKSNLNIWPPENGTTWVRYISEIAVIISCMSTVFFQIQEMYAQGLIYSLKNLRSEPAKVFFQISSMLFLVAVPFRFIKFPDGSSVTAREVEDGLVIVAIPCSWIYLLFFARVFNVTGPFVVMIYKMIVGDMLTFSYIYAIVLFGFSLSFYYLFKNSAHGVDSFDRFDNAIIISFQMTLGEFKDRVEEFNQVQLSDFTKVIFVAFMIMVHILLLNMLIAMMGNTYQQIIKKSEKEWRRQRAQIVILLERTFTAKQLKKYQEEYSIKLPKKNPEEKDQLGLMVIKKTAKTKAFQKNNAIKNWKKFGKMVLQIIKNKNMLSTTKSPVVSNGIKNWQKILAKTDTDVSLNTNVFKKNVTEVLVKSLSKKNETLNQKTELIPQQTLTSEISALQSKLLSQNLKTVFVPNQTNKIYPMFSNGNSIIETLIDSPISDDFQTECNEVQNNAKVNLPFILKKHDALSYIKRETYPKFTNIQNFQSFDGKNNSSGTSSKSELLKRNSSFDDESQDH